MAAWPHCIRWTDNSQKTHVAHTVAEVVQWCRRATHLSFLWLCLNSLYAIFFECPNNYKIIPTME